MTKKLKQILRAYHGSKFSAKRSVA